MKIKVNTSEFLKSIHAVEGVISAREIRSILSNLKLEAEGSTVSISATDLEISIKTSLSADVQESGSISLPAKQLSSIFKTIHFEEALLSKNDSETDSSITYITDATKKNDYKTKLNGMDAEEIKTISKVDPSIISEFPTALVGEMIRKTGYAIAHEDQRYIFNGLYMVPKEDKLIFAVTDGRRLCKIERNLPSPLKFKEAVIIPAKAIREISKMITTAETGKIGIVDNQIYVNANNIELLCKLIEGNFPNYEQVIPKSSKFFALIPKENFQIYLRQALIAAEEPTRQIRLTFSKDNLNFYAQTQGVNEVSINMPIDYSGDEITVAFKGEYLSDVFKSIDDNEFRIEFSDSSSPVVFKDPSDPDFISVIMPMKI
ncbi:DNA polymerase III, beta subunit [Leptospira broomii serovar Hurstbridge str. 5399]|uniref:Beta sliding clamp n=1 Tax=Leptospira broomii serovar Hurstbridge str. 5399 TaxID=1049789 RepID=T0FB55_9LEPT|nr:DNA polymerase III subunit beta [Leptospira broomii]EQA44817.1 DNA polymerase III, beta subunit [Leptospira broomii serovar Hurstbridge str. 5399]